MQRVDFKDYSKYHEQVFSQKESSDENIFKNTLFWRLRQTFQFTAQYLK